jgi:hypothetical protein
MSIYRVSLEFTSCGIVYVQAESKEEAREISEKILDKSPQPKWFEWGASEATDIAKLKD